MIGRNKNWTGQSDWMRAFNEKHNKGIHEEEKKKKIKKKNKKQKDNPFKFKIFRQQD